jgi:peptidoglycan/LPS O-acetylase OafA/YrhL
VRRSLFRFKRLETRDHLPTHKGVEKLHALTSLRFIAAAMIVVHHARGTFADADRFLPNVQLGTGVSFFFVLSGFILTHVYPSLHQEGAVRSFFIARFARIWPAHAFTLAIAVGLGMQSHLKVGDGPPTAVVGMANLAMVHSWIPATGWFFSFNPVSWSISTEVFFYCVFPLLIANFTRTWAWKLGLTVLAVVASCWICVQLQIPAFGAAQPFEVNRAGLVYVGPLARVAEFVLGMTAALAWKRWGGMIPRTLGLATMIEAVALVLCIGSVLAVGPFTAWVAGTWQIPFVTDAIAKYLVHSAAAPGFAVLIVVLASHRGWISRALGNPFLVFLGEVSFSVYLLHRILLDSLKLAQIDVPQSGGKALAAWLVFWLVLIIGSWAMWAFVERPFRSALLRLTGFRKPRAVPVPA